MADTGSDFKVENGVVTSGSLSFPISDISRISWGSINSKLNGVDIGTQYIIYFGDHENLATINAGTSDCFNSVTDQLWDAVAYPLGIRIASALKGGQALTFGSITVQDTKVSLAKASAIPFAGKGTPKSYDWSEVEVLSQDGRLWLRPINDDKGGSGSASYIEHYNTAVLAHLLRIMTSKGLNTISDVFTTREYSNFESEAKSTQAYVQRPGDKPNKLSIGQMVVLGIVILAALYFTMPK